MTELSNIWGVPVEGVTCPVCEWSFILVEGTGQRDNHLCPHCFTGQLTGVNVEDSRMSYQKGPELIIPPTVTEEKLALGISAFAEKIPFPPDDLQAVTLRQRLKLLFMPVWLVDCDVFAVWDAETGFDYDVVSHQEHFSAGNWATQEIEETRVRWEPRVGRLHRKFNNISVPALLEHTKLWDRLGAVRADQAQPYAAESIMRSAIRIPDLDLETAWAEVEPLLYQAAAAEVKVAAAANHIRNFRWAPNFREQNWTLLLTPLYTAYYADDNGQPQPVFIHAQTGQVDGVKRSSMKNAQKRSFTVAVIAFVLFMLGLIGGALSMLIPPLLIIGIFCIIIAACVGIGAFVPIIRAWRYNLQKEA